MSRRGAKVSLGPGVCDGCGKCIEACLKANTGAGRGVRKIVGIKLLKHGGAYVPVICRNCEDAPCVAACMSGCRQRNGKGRVMTDYTRCIGCWMCIMNCPFGAIERVEGEHVAVKCEGCPDRDFPPCAAACEQGLLNCGDIQDLARAERKRAAVRFLAGEGKDIRAK